MKKLTKALLPAIALLMASIVSLVGVTFAWFQTGKSAEIEDITAGVQTADGMLVSWDAATWVSKLNIADANYAAVTANGNTAVLNGAPSLTYIPVSTIGEIGEDEDGVIDFYTATISQDKIGTITKVEGTAGLFKMTFYVNVAADCTIYAKDKNNNSCTVTSAVDGSNSASAVRVAFVYAGHATSTAGAIELGASETRTVKIWEPNATTHTNDGWIDSGLDGTGEIKFDYYGISGAATTYPAERKSELNTDGSHKEELTFDHMSKVETYANSKDISFDVEAGISKIEVYVWLEGQDADCTNAISGGNLIVSIAFSKSEVAA